MKNEKRKHTIKTTIIQQPDKVLGLTICVQIFKYLEQNMKFYKNERAWLMNTNNTQNIDMNMTYETRHEHEFKL